MGGNSIPAPKCTLVPSHFFDPASARDILGEVVVLGDADEVRYLEVPHYDAVLVYAFSSKEQPEEPELYRILCQLPSCREYNKILASYKDGWLYLAIAQGGSLQLANAYPAVDFTTAEYYIFLALKQLQLNPELSTICFLSLVESEDELSLYRYFKNVEQL